MIIKHNAYSLSFIFFIVISGHNNANLIAPGLVSCRKCNYFYPTVYCIWGLISCRKCNVVRKFSKSSSFIAKCVHHTLPLLSLGSTDSTSVCCRTQNVRLVTSLRTQCTCDWVSWSPQLYWNYWCFWLYQDFCRDLGMDPFKKFVSVKKKLFFWVLTKILDPQNFNFAS